MAAQVSTNVAEVPRGYNDENVVAFEALIIDTTVTAADTVTITLPARWQGKAFNVLSISAAKYTTSGAVDGARTKTDVAIGVTSYVETTGVITATFVGAAANTTTVQIKVVVCICSLTEREPH